MFLCDHYRKFCTFSILYLWNKFSGKWNSFSKNWSINFLFESTKIENASFPYKTDISEAHVTTNRIVSTKWTYQKERSLASNYFIFLKNLFQFKRTSYKEMIWCTNDPNAHIRTFCRRWNFIWRYFFPVSILKRVQFYYLIVRNWRSHWLIKFSFGNIAADPSISTTGTIHVRNTYLAAANIKSTQKC